jgi:histidine phosphotransfer protein HptB
MSSLTIVDLEAIENLRALSPGDGDVFLKEILGIYLEDMPQRIAELHRSGAAGDTESFIRAAHSIKGSSSNVGATEVRSIAETIEHSSRKQGIAGQIEQIALLETAYARVQVELQKFLSI